MTKDEMVNVIRMVERDARKMLDMLIENNAEDEIISVYESRWGSLKYLCNRLGIE